MYEELEKEIQELENLLNKEEWDEMPNSDFSISVGKDGKFKFEIRTKEKCHYKGHFHVKASEKSGSYMIDPVSKRDGNFIGKDNDIIIDWANKHKDKLIQIWNQYHSEKKIGVQ